MILEKLSSGANLPEEFNVIIEIPANSSPVKYELDKQAGVIMVDRFVGTAMSYPFNYGLIPHTLSLDGDPVDVVVITPYPLAHGCVVKCRALGLLNMEDESGIDTKIIALPTKKSCQMYEQINQISELPQLTLDQIQYFFEHYKGLEKGKWVKLSGWGGIEAAHKEIIDSVARHSKG